MNIHKSRHSKEELPWAINRQLWDISNIMLFKTAIPKNKAILEFNNVCVAMRPSVMYSN